MLSLEDPRWGELSHAYGSATDIPQLLKRAQSERNELRQGNAWFDLWSALCHQGDAYSASFAAVPHLIALAQLQLVNNQYDALFLAASIELARLEGRAPAVPDFLASGYREAVSTGRALAAAAKTRSWSPDAKNALEISALAMAGNATAARHLSEVDDD